MTKDDVKKKAAELEIQAEGAVDRALAQLIASGISGRIVAGALAVTLLAGVVIGALVW